MAVTSMDVVRRIYEAWAGGRSAAPLIEKDLEYVNPPDAVESGTRHGRHYLSAVRDVYPDFRVEPERFLENGNDVVVIASIRGRGRGSGLETQWRQGYIWTVENGKATRFRWFNDPDDALRAAGLFDQS